MPADQLGAELLARFDASQALPLGSLLLARILPVTFVAPFFGGATVPAPVKMAVGLAIAVVLFPSVRAQSAGAVPEGSLWFLALFAKELAIGFAIAFVASLVFRAAEMAGQAVDTLRGANLATALVPQSGERVSVFADLWMQTLVVLFFAVGGHHFFLVAFADSYAAIPIGAFPTPAVGLGPAAEWIVRLTGDLFRVAFALAAPALVALLLTDLLLGLASRVAPNIQMFFLGMPLKALLGIVMVLLSAHVLIAVLQGNLGESLDAVRRLIDLFK